MRFQLLYKPYLRKFSRSVRFGDICVNERKGAIVRLMDSEGHVGYGEIAPLESFGSESLEKSLKFLKGFCGVITQESVYQIDESEYSCTSYALLKAMKEIKTQREGFTDVSDADSQWVSTTMLIQNDCLDDSVRSFSFESDLKVVKLKIANESSDLEMEKEQVGKIIQYCKRRGVSVRLDANEKLSSDETKSWLEFLEPFENTVEFLEQPMDRWLLSEMFELTNEFKTRIALDESVGILQGQIDLQYLDRFVFVLKPSLGDLAFARWNKINTEQVVLSSVFETAIGFSDLLNLSYNHWTPGFDTQRVFDDRFVYPGDPSASGYRRGQIDKERLWNLLG